uniref:Bloodthirsty n=1 Tax=Sphaeramia orbicularis TaxID=375764 RepID=A0A672YZU8_9TELE
SRGDMAASAHVRPEDQFLCSICLDMFTDPVSTTCGHNFCKNCITQHWDNTDQYLCPMCKTVFNTRPELKINTLFQQAAKPGEVPCDVCTETKLKALKSCLVCLTSYCDTHLQPHLTLSGLKRHHLMDPVEKLADRMCMKHDKPLELFCKTDHACVCMFCTVLEHKTHDVVPLKDEYELKKAELRKTEAEIQQMIQERRLKIQDIQHTEKQAEDFIKELEQEICELKKRSTEVETLSHSEDHLHFVQTFTSIGAAPPMKVWKQVSVRPPSYEGTVVRAVSQLEEELSKDMKDLFENELKRVQQFTVDVSLDPDTAHPALFLSDDEKQVHLGDVKQNLPHKPESFSECACVLGKQSFSSGRFYFEVQVKGKTDWELGVVRESINRKGPITPTPEDGHWIISLRNGNEYKAFACPLVYLSLKSIPQKVGVFVDYEEGLVSFYDVDSAALIFSFTGYCFSDNLLPIFGPGLNDEGKNSAPLIITTVKHTE